MKLKTRYSAGLAIVCNKKILLMHTTGRADMHSYGIPKGGLEKSESNLQAAIRETQEESGIKVPKELIDKTEYTFVVTSQRYKYNKVVTYFIVHLKNISQIGLKDIKVPKNQLQLKEVDIAEFFDYRESMDRIMKSQAPVITTLLNKGLI
jgi:8-oxo-dGTP pyrophosphatase MutT (NUDIX family)